MEHKLIVNRKGDNKQGYRLGIALSGGGARGFAHAGALKAIDEAGLKPDIMAGVSAGSVVAVLYAAGVKPDVILDMFTGARLVDLAEISPGKGGLLKINRFTDYITRALGKITDLSQLQLPTYVGVTNIDEGRPEEFHQGEIGPIIKASCSIPIAIQPVKIGDTTYVDGGVLRNLPAWTIRDKCDKLIGINVSPLMSPPRNYKSVYSIALRSYALMAKTNQAQDAAMCDMTVTIDEISAHPVFSLAGLHEVFEAGYRKMKQTLAENDFI